MVISSELAERVPTPVMTNTKTGEAFMLGDVHDNPGNPLSPTGFIFPFDERCFVDEAGHLHSAAGFTLSIVDMVRMINQINGRQAHRTQPMVMSRQVFQKLSETEEGTGVLHRFGLLPMFHDEQSTFSDISIGADPPARV